MRQLMKAMLNKSVLMVMCSMLSLVASMPSYASTNSNQLEKIRVMPLPDNRAKVIFEFDGTLKDTPRSFMTKKPARLVIDIPHVKSNVAAKDLQALKTLNLGNLQKITATSDLKRLRVVLDLRSSVTYTTKITGKLLTLNIKGKSIGLSKIKNLLVPRARSQSNSVTNIREVDFTAIKNHGGQIVLDISNPNVSLDLQQQGRKLIVNLVNTIAARKFRHRYDVTDFGTPVKHFDIARRGDHIQLVVYGRDDFDHYAYQVKGKLVIDIVPINAATAAKKSNSDKRYNGKRISLNFQNIKVRSVLQLLSEFTGNNMVISDTVAGNVTLRLHNVPWDQALDIILKTRGLAMRKIGSIMLIAPATEIAEREKKELESQKQVQELAPLRSELVQINYAKAEDIASLLKEKNNSLLSPRGNVSMDNRTNTLWIQDTPRHLTEIRTLVQKLDVPVRQVLIEARIVIVDKNFERDLGIRFGVTRPNHLSGTLAGASDLANLTPASEVPFEQRLNLNLPALPSSGDPATVGIALAKLGRGILLDLELSALESEGRGEIISSPRLITANQQTATIESGEEIPFQEATSSGATAISFKKAVLSLKVTPQITPDNKVILDLQVNQDTPSVVRYNGVPAIETKEIRTNVLVDNGQTVVLGGIYRQDKTTAVKRVPFFGTLPLVGNLFRSKATTSKREELLIFVTPKVIEQSLNQH